MKLLDVLLDYEAHLGCVARLLQPVVDALEPLLEPWVQRAMPLADAWEALLVDKQLDALDSVHSNWEPKGYTSIYMGAALFLPGGNGGDLLFKRRRGAFVYGRGHVCGYEPHGGGRTEIE